MSTQSTSNKHPNTSSSFDWGMASIGTLVVVISIVEMSYSTAICSDWNSSMDALTKDNQDNFNSFQASAHKFEQLHATHCSFNPDQDHCESNRPTPIDLVNSIALYSNTSELSNAAKEVRMAREFQTHQQKIYQSKLEQKPQHCKRW